MPAKNVDRLLCFYEDDRGRQRTLRELNESFPWRPAGTNTYYWITAENARLLSESTALPPQDKEFWDGVITDLGQVSQDPVTVILGLEPHDRAEGGTAYRFVRDHLSLLSQLAVDLRGYQDQATALGRTLDIVVRYASEMNDPSNKTYGNDPDGYLATFPLVRDLFRTNAPAIRFAFSPAIRGDLRHLNNVHSYWPGDANVDIIGGTWYLGEPNQKSDGIGFLENYVSAFVPKGLPYGLDEMGATAAGGSTRDKLQEMFGVIADLSGQGVHFTYATVFMQGRFLTSEPLDFLDSPVGGGGD
jgi:hypothetical protein